MAVAISRTANPAGVAASSNVATYSSQSIGVAHLDRIVAICVTSELASASPNSATYDSGGGDTAMTAGSLGNFGAVYARIFYARIPTGTTATFKVTYGANPSATQNHITVYRTVGAAFTLSASGNDSSTDMDATDRLTTGSQTVPTGGGFLAVVAGATDTNAKSWGGGSVAEDVDADAGAYRHTTAFHTTAETATYQCTGTSNGEDGAMSWIIFGPSLNIAANGGSYAVTGAAATVEHDRKVAAAAGSYAVTGADATPRFGKSVVLNAGSYIVTGGDAGLAIGEAPNLSITAEGGSYLVTGADATPKATRILVGDAGGYTVTGGDATTRQAKKTVAGGGSYLVTGGNAVLKETRILAAAAGLYTVAGGDAALKLSKKTVADGGSYTVTGTDALPALSRILTAEGGSYLVNGTDALLIRPRIIAAEAGVYLVTGGDAYFINFLSPDPAPPWRTFRRPDIDATIREWNNREHRRPGTEAAVRDWENRTFRRPGRDSSGHSRE